MLKIATLSLVFLITGLAVGSAQADESQLNFAQRDSVQRYVKQISAEHNLDPVRIAAYFNEISSQESILEAISRPAERRLQWREYRPIFITQRRIDEGKAFMAEHSALLAQAEARFGVPAAVITSIIGVETYYGRITGSFGVLEALATLAFDYPPRAGFFKREMTEFILLSEKEGWDTVNLKGSYAGAMGMPQFISSSYRAYAVDFDRDGKRNLFDNHADVIGSVANYLNRHGWVRGAAIAEQWVPQNGISQDMRELVSRSLKPVIDPARLSALGFDSDSLRSAERANSTVSVMTMQADEGEQLWVGYRNFYAITRYNHSRLYALAVYQLSEAIRPGT